MKKQEVAHASIIKMVIVCIVIIFGLGIAVRAGNLKLNNINIKLSDSSEIAVVSSKTKVSEILDESHIIVLSGETVVPGLDEEIKEDKTIKITKNVVSQVVLSETSNEEISTEMKEIVDSYVPIVEKIIVETTELSFQTITKDISEGAADKTEKVIQEGKNGIKEVTYLVKYKNDVEFERTELSSKVVKEPVDKIIQVNVKVTSRSADRDPAEGSSNDLALRVAGKDPSVITMNTSAYCACVACCGKTNAITSSGAKATTWYTLAAGKGYPIGTIVYIPYFADKPNGGWFMVQDRGGAISNNKLDVYMGSHSQALQFGRRSLECYVYTP